MVKYTIYYGFTIFFVWWCSLFVITCSVHGFADFLFFGAGPCISAKFYSTFLGCTMRRQGKRIATDECILVYLLLLLLLHNLGSMPLFSAVPYFFALQVPCPYTSPFLRSSGANYSVRCSSLSNQ